MDRLWELFERASTLAPEERDALLVSLRAEDPALADELAEMLFHHERRGLLDDTPVISAETLHDRMIGREIGPYRIEALLGRGGMGAVYLAEQREPVRRRVALKLIRETLDRRSVIARFAAERQALALMQHPAIAAIHDAGETADGRPYFVMEHVEGSPVTDYCDDVRLSVRDRLLLFRQVCLGVQHAHQKGIIHRDLKPSNILVTLQDGIPRPKVIDFGIARAVTDDDATERQTRMGGIVGTPEYMSPEQADTGGADVDTRSDVFSLCVVLYELLTGRLPHDPETLRRAGPAELQRILGDTSPLTPSRSLATLSDREAAVASRRATTPDALRARLAGDLDWIVMKGLEPDRSRRYESAAALADDLGRHLEHRPVEAGPPSIGYRTRKFVRRHRVAVAASLTGAVALVVAFAGVTVGLLRTRRALEEANRQRQMASQVLAVLEDTFTQVSPVEAQGRDTSLLEEILATTATRVDRELTDNPEAAGELHLTLARAYRALGADDDSERHALRAVALLGDTQGAEATETLAARNLLAMSYWQQGRHDEAEALHRELHETRSRVLGAEHPDTLISLNNLAIAIKSRGDLGAAAELLERCVQGRRRTLGETDDATLTTMSNLARVRQDLEQLDEAEKLMREVVRVETELHGAADARTLHSIDILGGVVASAGRLDEAETLHREALAGMRRIYGERHPTTLGSLYNLGKLQIQAGRFEEAERTLRGVAEIVRADLGDDHRYARLVGQHRAWAMCNIPGRGPDGLAEFERVQASSAAARGESDPDQAMLDLQHGECLIVAGRQRAARDRLERALTALEAFYGPASSRTHRAREALESLDSS